jgi:hypothetical protein
LVAVLKKEVRVSVRGFSRENEHGTEKESKTTVEYKQKKRNPQRNTFIRKRYLSSRSQFFVKEKMEIQSASSAAQHTIST